MASIDAARASAGLVTLHAKRIVGRDWQYLPILVRGAAIIAVEPHHGPDGVQRGSRVLVAQECWLHVTETPDAVAQALCELPDHDCV